MELNIGSAYSEYSEYCFINRVLNGRKAKYLTLESFGRRLRALNPIVVGNVTFSFDTTTKKVVVD